ncbi:hypothetical protein ICHIJ1_16360 [Fluviibacter phosphoraccumulans]|jgi:hypothetical protein|uniref:Uncharacterized protein n=1 Tax=Fluviibacter phosphoraccumulans TaxID=1751046 RepID=A0A679I8S6_9RHOO|nr:hypothetical protein ICHIAU1_14090 [Fluviibacter phosphoraccumulans]BBU71717.1 hypothetical protein ICHIJ1_16360 [Fluviibacter phosphoraccumulans]BCA65062.1 hypothetical protein SHINM1_006640 [Fluviibacter phosphoraccumulans]
MQETPKPIEANGWLLMCWLSDPDFKELSNIAPIVRDKQKLSIGSKVDGECRYWYACVALSGLTS